MAIDVTVTSPDGATTITLKCSKITELIKRTAANTSIPGNKTIEVDLGMVKKQFTLTCDLTTDAGELDKVTLEALENAAQTWYSQSESNDGRTLFTWSTKNDASDKDYRVIWITLDIVENVERSPNAYLATITLEEAGDLSTSG